MEIIEVGRDRQKMMVGDLPNQEEIFVDLNEFESAPESQRNNSLYWHALWMNGCFFDPGNKLNLYENPEVYVLRSGRRVYPPLSCEEARIACLKYNFETI